MEPPLHRSIGICTTMLYKDVRLVAKDGLIWFAARVTYETPHAKASECLFDEPIITAIDVYRKSAVRKELLEWAKQYTYIANGDLVWVYRDGRFECRG